MAKKRATSRPLISVSALQLKKASKIVTTGGAGHSQNTNSQSSSSNKSRKRKLSGSVVDPAPVSKRAATSKSSDSDGITHNTSTSLASRLTPPVSRKVVTTARPTPTKAPTSQHGKKSVGRNVLGKPHSKTLSPKKGAVVTGAVVTGGVNSVASSEVGKNKNRSPKDEKKKRSRQKKYKKRKGVETKTASNSGESQSATQVPQTAAPTKQKSTKASAVPVGNSNWKKLAEELGVDVAAAKPALSKVRVSKRSITDGDEKKKEIWFDGVDEDLLEDDDEDEDLPKVSGTEDAVKPGSVTGPPANAGLTRAVAMDCEMVGTGYKGADSIVARISLVNQRGVTLYDQFVKPVEKVTDFRTHVSGVRHKDLKTGVTLASALKSVNDLTTGRILVGHALENDMKVLFLSHPKRMMRDTSRYKPFRRLFDGRKPSLKKLAEHLLGITIQDGEHSSVVDARAAMKLYMLHKKEWEAPIKAPRKGPRKIPGKRGTSKGKKQSDASK